MLSVFLSRTSTRTVMTVPTSTSCEFHETLSLNATAQSSPLIRSKIYRPTEFSMYSINNLSINIAESIRCLVFLRRNKSGPAESEGAGSEAVVPDSVPEAVRERPRAFRWRTRDRCVLRRKPIRRLI